MEQLGLIFEAPRAGNAPPHDGRPPSGCQSATTPRARRNDPTTSKTAAAAAGGLAADHQARILRALDAGDGTIYELAARTGLTHVQIARRMLELDNAELAKPTEETRKGPSGRPCRVWARNR